MAVICSTVSAHLVLMLMSMCWCQSDDQDVFQAQWQVPFRTSLANHWCSFVMSQITNREKDPQKWPRSHTNILRMDAAPTLPPTFILFEDVSLWMEVDGGWLFPHLVLHPFLFCYVLLIWLLPHVGAKLWVKYLHYAVLFWLLCLLFSLNVSWSMDTGVYTRRGESRDGAGAKLSNLHISAGLCWLFWNENRKFCDTERQHRAHLRLHWKVHMDSQLHR